MISDNHLQGFLSANSCVFADNLSMFWGGNPQRRPGTHFTCAAVEVGSTTVTSSPSGLWMQGRKPSVRRVSSQPLTLSTSKICPCSINARISSSEIRYRPHTGQSRSSHGPSHITRCAAPTQIRQFISITILLL